MGTGGDNGDHERGHRHSGYMFMKGGVLHSYDNAN